MHANSLNKGFREANIDENTENEQKKWSSIAGKKRKERLALLQG